MEGDAKVKANAPTDAAALIAEALKRKFAHRYRHDSEQEGNEDFKLPVQDVKPQTETPLVRDVTVFNKPQTPQNQPLISSLFYQLQKLLLKISALIIYLFIV